MQYLRKTERGALLRLRFRYILGAQRSKFTADHVGREAGSQQGAVQGGKLPVIDFASHQPQLAVDALTDHGSLVGMLGGLVDGRVDVAIRYAPGAQLARDAVFALPANLRALVDELLGVACVVDQAVLLQA